jgi:hypothetical protein
MHKLIFQLMVFSIFRRFWAITAFVVLAATMTAQTKLYTGKQTTYNNLTRYGTGAPTFNPSGSVYDTLAWSYIDTSQSTHPITYEWAKTKWFVTSEVRQPSPPMAVATTPNPDIDYTMAVWIDTDDGNNKFYYDLSEGAWMPLGNYRGGTTPSDVAATGSTGAVTFRKAFWYDTVSGRVKSWNGSSWVDVTAGDNWGSQAVAVNARLQGNGTSGTPLDLATTGITPNSYTLPNVTVNPYGQITAISNGVVNLGSQVTGTLSAINGGTGLSSLGTANQLIRVNGSATALEYFTPSYITGNQTITLTGAVTGSGTTSITTTLSALGATASGQVLTWNGSAWAAAAPTGGVTGSGVSNRVALWNGTSSLSSNSLLTYDSILYVLAPGGVGVNSVMRVGKSGGWGETVIGAYYTSSKWGMYLASQFTPQVPYVYFETINGSVGFNTMPASGVRVHVGGNFRVNGELQASAGSAGTSGQYLISAGAGSPPVWTSINNLTGSGVANRVPYYSAANTFTNSANLTFSGNTLAATSSSAGTAAAILSVPGGTSSNLLLTFDMTGGFGSTFFHQYYTSGTQFGMEIRAFNGTTVLMKTNNRATSEDVRFPQKVKFGADAAPTEMVDVAGNIMFSGVMKAANGSASSSSYTFASDPNTGINLTSADRMSFNTNGISRFEVGSSGEWYINGSAGSGGQFMQSNGAGAAPSWATGSLLPSGSTGQTLRHNGSNWVANSVITNDGTNATATAPMRFAIGSASLPSLTPISDPDNGWSFPTADAQAWSTNGLQRMQLIGSQFNTSNLTNWDITASTQWSLFIGSQGLYGVSNAVTAQTADFIVVNPLAAGLPAAGLVVYEDNDNPTPQRIRFTVPTITANYDQTFTPASGEVGVWLRTSTTIDFASTGSGSINEVTVTLTGAVVGKPCIVGTSLSIQGLFTAYCTTSGQVVVRYTNTALVSLDPSSASFEIHQKL